MKKAFVTELKQLGLSAAEARIYLALLNNGGLGASALAHAIGAQRTTVYPILTSLTHKGIIEADEGYGSRFTAVPPDKALPFLIAREQQEILERQRLAEEELLQRQNLVTQLVEQFESAVAPVGNNGDAEFIQVLRDPRVIAERFERLQLEAERQVELFVKAPIFNPRYSNPTEATGMRRGVRYRCIYERAIIDTAEVKPYLSSWIAAGEEARVHEGELPHKLAIFDRQNILMPLITPGGNGRTLFIRHPQLATSLGMLFDFLWERAGQLPPVVAKYVARKRLTATSHFRRYGRGLSGT